MKKNRYKPVASKSGLFTYLERTVPFQKLFVDGLPVRYIPPMLFLLFLGLIYVANNHFHEKMIRTINHLEQDVGMLKVEFTSLKASYMLDSKQSSVAERVSALGLYEVNHPPFKLKLSQ
jgi:hypothetical protein